MNIRGRRVGRRICHHNTFRATFLIPNQRLRLLFSAAQRRVE
jgi:hypothetical protein